MKKKKKRDESVAQADKKSPIFASERKVRSVIIHPLVSEKAQAMQSKNQYTFLVNPSANKNVVKEEVEWRYGVKVVKTNMVQIQGKPKRFRNIIGKRSKIKKATVTLKVGDKIEVV